MITIDCCKLFINKNGIRQENRVYTFLIVRCVLKPILSKQSFNKYNRYIQSLNWNKTLISPNISFQMFNTTRFGQNDCWVCFRRHILYIKVRCNLSSIFSIYFLSPHCENFHFVILKLNFHVIWYFSVWKIYTMNLYIHCMKHSIAFCVLL